jgi:hypothetical protein
LPAKTRHTAQVSKNSRKLIVSFFIRC